MRIKGFLIFLVISLFAPAAYAKEREGTVVVSIDLGGQPVAETRLWMPYPVSDGNQTIGDVQVAGNYDSSGISKDAKSGVNALYASWNSGKKERTLTMTFRVSSKEIASSGLKDAGLAVPDDIKPYLAGEKYLPVDGKIAETASEIAKGKKGILEKARAVYDWVLENTYRDTNIKGCGTGAVERILSERGGKCADISSIFVALARASGVPARDVWGLRLGKKPEQDITSGFHCWAEFYLPGAGWIPADPADVRKIMLEGNLDINQAKQYADYYFGSIDEYRMVLERGARGVILNPKQKGPELGYFLYPYAEVGGEPLDYFEPKAFKYSVMFRE